MISDSKLILTLPSVSAPFLSPVFTNRVWVDDVGAFFGSYTGPEELPEQSFPILESTYTSICICHVHGRNKVQSAVNGLYSTDKNVQRERGRGRDREREFVPAVSLENIRSMLKK